MMDVDFNAVDMIVDEENLNGELTFCDDNIAHSLLSLLIEDTKINSSMLLILLIRSNVTFAY